MSFNDILENNDHERVRGLERRQLRLRMTPACEDLLHKARAEIERVLRLTPGLMNIGAIGTGLPPPHEEDSVQLNVCIGAHTRAVRSGSKSPAPFCAAATRPI